MRFSFNIYGIYVCRMLPDLVTGKFLFRDRWKESVQVDVSCRDSVENTSKPPHFELA